MYHLKRLFRSVGLAMLTLAVPITSAQEAVAGETPPPPPAASPSEATTDSIFAAGHGIHGQGNIGMGAFYDALDPRAAAGAKFRVPQLSLDGRIGVGHGFSLLTHLNTALVMNEFGFGANYSFPVVGKLRALAQLQAGFFYGVLGQFGFNSSVFTPQLRPLIGLSMPALGLNWSLRGEIVFGIPQFAKAGDLHTTISTAKPISNVNVMLYMERPLPSGDFWYAGLGVMNSTLSYQLWVLFPDSQNNAYYPRLTAGYEF